MSKAQSDSLKSPSASVAVVVTSCEKSDCKLSAVPSPIDNKAAKEAEAAASQSDYYFKNFFDPARLTKIIKEEILLAYNNRKTPSRTMKVLCGIVVASIVLLGILSIVLANRDDSVVPPVAKASSQQQSGSNKFGMSFTLDDAMMIQRKNQGSNKAVIFGVIPGEGASAIISNSVSEATASSTTTAPPSDVNNDNDDGFGLPVDKITNETKDAPAEGTITITADLDSLDSDSASNKSNNDDQRIVFIERLMGLHLNASPSEEVPSAPHTDDDEESRGNRVKWSSSSRVRKFPGSEIGEGIPHPMLRYAAAAMMSRLIAAAARAQMEAQAREQAMMMRSLMSERTSGKDKDDMSEAEEESVPVLLASLRSERTVSPMSMYGRPAMSSRNSRGPLDIGMPSSRSRMMMMSSNGIQSPAFHPLLQHLQTLQALTAIQRLQHSQSVRGGRSRDSIDRLGSEGIMMIERASSGPSDRPAMVMLAIPMGERSESLMSGQQKLFYPPSPVRSYDPYSAYRPMSHSYPMHAYPSYQPYHVAYPPPMHPSASYGYPVHHAPPMSRSGHYPHPHSYHPHSYAAPHMTFAATHSRGVHPHHQSQSYHQGRPVIEVPIEVPVPVHVPVPVPYPSHEVSGPLSAQTAYHGLPAHTVVGAAAAVAAGRVAGEEHSSNDNAPSDSDQIVLFYDADAQNENEGPHNAGNNGQNHQDSGDDLQSSASEHKMFAASKAHAFLSSHPMVSGSNPSINKMKLFREMMSQKHASQPGIRYLPVAVQSEVEQEGPAQQPKALKFQGLPARLAIANVQQQNEQQQNQQQPNGQQEQNSGQSQQHVQPAFLVIQDERDQPQAVERRR